MHHNLPNLKKGDLVAGRFRIVEIVGSGGFSIVYRAHQEGMNRFVALKVLKPKASADAQIVERFRREALYASHLSHPNTITLFDYGHTEDGLCYIAMEYLQGTDLSDVVALGQPVALRRVWKILSQCCRSLAEAHRLGLVHRDLKPENIFLVLRKDGEFVKVLDFGVSKAISDFGAAGPRTMAPLTQEGTVFGTPLYMAPEQAMAEEITPAVDVYAMGHIGFEMITGRAAYADSTNAMDVMLRQINDPPLKLPSPWNMTPFHDLIERSTQKDSRRRFEDASEMLAALMDESFLSFMEPSDYPSGIRTQPQRLAVEVPEKEVDTLPTDPFGSIAQAHPAEFELLYTALAEVATTGKARFVVLEGDNRSPRSEILHTFLLKASEKERSSQLLHRPPRARDGRRDVGLEGELSRVTGLELKTTGIDELHRLLGQIDGQDNGLSADDVHTDSSPLDQLSTMREQLLLRLSRPFRKAAQDGLIVWGLESLENADALTLAFLDWFIDDLQREDAPFLIVATVHPETLIQRPGMLRYTRALLTTPSPRLRKLTLGISPENENDAFMTWRSETDRNTSPQPTQEVIGEDEELVGVDADGPRTERVELFDTSEHESADPQNDGREAFDEVLGLLAQLGSGPIPKVLWHRVVHELLEGPVALRANFIIKHSGRFGILDDTPDELTFAKPHFVEALSKSFDEQDDAAELHAKLAKILLDHHKEPTDEQVRRILSHALAGQEIELAIKLLSDAGEAAYRRLELDAAREHYIQLRSLIEEGPSGARNAADESPDRFARMWLRLGEIHGALGEHGAAQDALQRVLEQTDDSAYRLRGAASKLLADLAMWQNRFEFALEHYELAQEYFRKAALPRPFVATIAEMGRCALLLGRLRKAEALLTQGLDKARALDDVNLMARMHRYLGQTLSRLGDFGEANDHLEQAALLFEKLERPMDLVATLDDLGKNHLAGGRYGVSRDIYVKLAGLVSESGLSPSRSPLVGQAKALAAMSDFEQAEFHLVEALSHFSGRGEAVEAAEVQFCLGDLYLATKRPKLAGEHYAHVWERAQAVGHARLAFDAAMRQAYAAFDEGDAEKAYDFLTSGAEYATGLGQDDAVQLARTHIIYLQLLEHGFRTGADAFSSLQSAENPGRTQRSQLVREIFRADMAIARKDWTEASKRLDNAHTLAAFCSEYGLFLHINRRKALVSKKLDQSFEGPTHDGAALGSLLPPEVGARRPRHS